MLIGAGATKIHVCAPSNAAVDEILIRLSEQGLLSVDGETVQTKGLLLRVGALEYDPVDAVQQHTLDNRLQETLMDAREYDHKKKIDACDELLMILASEEAIDFRISRQLMLIRLTVCNDLKGMKKFCKLAASDQRSKLNALKLRTLEEQSRSLKEKQKY